MLKRKLLYTGITRAKEKLILVGDLNSFRQGIEHVEATRQSVLKEKIIEKVMLKEEPKKEMKKEDWKVLNDPTLPFDFIGEELNGLSPYDFLKE
jgi:exodeoxyribonuclease V alpha subunit